MPPCRRRAASAAGSALMTCSCLDQVLSTVTRYDFRPYVETGFAGEETLSVMTTLQVRLVLPRAAARRSMRPLSPSRARHTQEISLLTHPNVAPLLEYKWNCMARYVHLLELAGSTLFNIVACWTMSQLVSGDPRSLSASREDAGFVVAAIPTLPTNGAKERLLWLTAAFQAYGLLVLVCLRFAGYRVRRLWAADRVNILTALLMGLLQASLLLPTAGWCTVTKGSTSNAAIRHGVLHAENGSVLDECGVQRLAMAVLSVPRGGAPQWQLHRQSIARSFAAVPF